jgi:hypothetical protein
MEKKQTLSCTPIEIGRELDLKACNSTERTITRILLDVMNPLVVFCSPASAKLVLLEYFFLNSLLEFRQHFSMHSYKAPCGLKTNRTEPMSIRLGGLTLGLLLLLIPLARVYANSESFSIFTDKQDYVVGEPIIVYVKANSIDPNQTITVTVVVVYDPSNITIAKWQNISIVLTDTITTETVGTLTAPVEGSYTVDANATGCAFILHSCWHFCCHCWCPKTVPDFPLGTIGAMAALFGATGIYITRKKYRIKK